MTDSLQTPPHPGSFDDVAFCHADFDPNSVFDDMLASFADLQNDDSASSSDQPPVTPEEPEPVPKVNTNALCSSQPMTADLTSRLDSACVLAEHAYAAPEPIARRNRPAKTKRERDTDWERLRRSRLKKAYDALAGLLGARDMTQAEVVELAVEWIAGKKVSHGRLQASIQSLANALGLKGESPASIVEAAVLRIMNAQ